MELQKTLKPKQSWERRKELEESTCLTSGSTTKPQASRQYGTGCCCCLVASVVSSSVRPQRLQPTRLPHPWDSPGKNTGVGCHFLLQCMKVQSEREVAQLCPTLCDPMDCSLPGYSVHAIFQARVLEWGAIAFSDSMLWGDLNPKKKGYMYTYSWFTLPYSRN